MTAVPPPPITTTILSRYVTEEPIGEGGTAIVHRATDTRIGRPVAIKRFKEDSADKNDPEYLAELEAISRINHPNVVCSYDADQDEDGCYIVMELIDGIDTEDLIQHKPMDLTTFLDFAEQSLKGLHATHSTGLLHLDLKPSNIMVTQTPSGRRLVKLVDYGRAECQQNERGNQPRGRGMDGSVYYAAPEQFLSEPLDRRTDLYSLGCVFYWCLTGTRPFQGENAMVIMASHIQNRVTPISELAPTLPAWLCDWVMSLVNLKGDDRPLSARHALESLYTQNAPKEEVAFSRVSA